MKAWKKPFAYLLLLGVLASLAGCSQKDTEDPAQAAAICLYENAIAPILDARDLALTVSTTQQRTLSNGACYSQNMSASVSYTGLDTEQFQGISTQSLTFGTSQNAYTEFYTAGKAYCQCMGTVFSCEMTQERFLERQVPAILLTPELYRTVTSTQGEDRTLLEFSGGTALESWVTEQSAEFIGSSGTVTLDPEGTLLQSVYRAKYRLGSCTYDLTFTVKASPIPENSKKLQLPAIGESCVALSCFDAPKMLLQATGDILAANAITTHCTEKLDCQLAGIQRTQQVHMNTWNQDSTYLARVDFIADNMDDIGNTSHIEQTELFTDGKKTVFVTGNPPISQPEYSSEQMKKYCEGNALSALFSPSRLAAAELTQENGLLHLQMQGSEALADALCSSIYESLLTGNLDSFAESYTSEGVQGYLTLDQNTYLPVACGISLGRTHTVEGNTYSLTYSIAQTLALSSDTAYEAICPPET